MATRDREQCTACTGYVVSVMCTHTGRYGWMYIHHRLESAPWLYLAIIKQNKLQYCVLIHRYYKLYEEDAPMYHQPPHPVPTGTSRPILCVTQEIVAALLTDRSGVQQLTSAFVYVYVFVP